MRVEKRSDLNCLGPEWNLYRKKPVIISATKLKNRVGIETREGTLIGLPGEYLIEGIQGELYPCKPDIFHKTYERVD